MHRYPSLTALFLIGLTIAALAPLSLPAQERENVMDMSLEDILNLQVTTASKSAERLSDAPGVISVVTRDELERFGATTLKDVLERVPGLISTVGFLSDRTLVAARGDQVKSNSGHVLLLINGRPARDVTGGLNSDLYENFPVNVIDKIEVIKGPGSVLYGSDAFSAVINVITVKAESNALSLTGLAGNRGAYGTSGDARLKVGDLSVVAAGRYYQKAKWEAAYNYIDYIWTQNLNNKLVDIPDKGPGAYLGLNYKGLSIMSAYSDWTTAFFTAGLTGTVQWKKSFNDLGYSLKVRENWNMNLNVTYLHSIISANSLIKAVSHNLIAEWTNSINLTNRSKLVLGGLYNYNQCLENSLDPLMPGMVYADANQSSYALYAQFDYRLLENLKWIGGMQANKPNYMKMNVVPRTGIIWQPASRFSVKALYSEAFKTPFLTERYLNMPFMVKGNPDLKPEKVATFDIGFSYQGEQIQAGVNYFQSRQTNIVQLDYSAGLMGFYSNLGKVDFQGFEFEAKYYFNRSFYANGSMLYQDNHDGNGKQNVTPVANLGTKAGISYASGNGITISLFHIYQGDLNKRFKDNLNPYQGAYNLLHLYGKISINRLLAMKRKPEFSLIVDIKNLLNDKHNAYNWGDIVPNVVPANPGRAIYVGLNASL